MIGVQTKSTASRLIGHALIIGLCLLVAFPLYWMLVTSVRPSSDFFNISLFPTGFTLEHYQYVLSNLPFGRLFLNTAAMASARTLAQVLTALLAAYAFARWNFVGKRFLFAMFTFTWLVPQQVTMIPNYVLVSQLGWLNALAGLIVPSMVSTFALFLLFQQIKGFPQDLFDAARVDGGSSWMILWQVLVPNLRAVIASLAILQFISAWNDYFWPLLVSNRMETGVLQLGLQAFFTQEGDLWGPMMAAATLTALPIFVVYVILQRQVVDSFIKSGLR
ncbi:MAG: carbohydrate ABC transporter permease [Anaerolineae bacterium]|nr:carbohydrate ABC transporter permease [Anaerolineae bacterium]